MRDVPVHWHSGSTIMSASLYEPGKAPGKPGLRFRRDLPAGSARFTVDEPNGQPRLEYTCPCGCGQVGSLSLAPIVTMGQTGWDWNGDRVAIVIWPSIAKKWGCKWHGHLGGPNRDKPGIWTTVDGGEWPNG